jgi:DNA-binding FrmR family transcriptional regulator
MKYKEQALNKIEKIEHQVRALEVSINRGNDLSEIVNTINNIKEAVEDLRGTISIENDEWN